MTRIRGIDTGGTPHTILTDTSGRPLLGAGTANIGDVDVLTIPATFKRHEVTEHPFGRGNLGTAGIQWDTEVGSGTAANTNATVGSATINPPAGGAIAELELGLTAALRGTSTTADLQFVWQGKNNAGTTWVDLHGTITETNIGTAYVERTMSGYRGGVANFGSVPLDIRLLFQCNEATNAGSAKIKNSSYARMVYDEA